MLEIEVELTLETPLNIGSGAQVGTLADRAMIANMSPENGATITFFPVDDETLNYLRLTGRSPDQLALVEAYAKEQGLFRTPDQPQAEYTSLVELDMARIEPSLEAAFVDFGADRDGLLRADDIVPSAFHKKTEKGGKHPRVDKVLERGKLILTDVKIMVVDDESIVGRRLKPALEKSGYEVEVFTDSASALARLEETCFDIFITDLKMEGVDGMGFLERVKEKCPASEVIVITGYGTLESAREALVKGAYDFIAKPFRLGEILAVVKKAKKRVRRR